MTNPTGIIPGLSKLARYIADHTPHDGVFELAVPGLSAIRYSRPNRDAYHALRPASVCIVAQGSKTTIVGREKYTYDPSQMLVFSVALPFASHIKKATTAEPYLALMFDLDPHRLADFVLKIFPQGVPALTEKPRAIYVSGVDEALIGATTRLMECLKNRQDLKLLAPLVVDEILVRLLRGPIGVRVAQIGFAGSSVQRMSKAITWMRANYNRPIKIQKLAESVNMSVSSFHQHFRAVTTMSPLKFQKILRLQEARRMLLSMTLDVAAASQIVGYSSASQFSREYRRLFGKSPMKDIAQFLRK